MKKVDWKQLQAFIDSIGEKPSTEKIKQLEAEALKFDEATQAFALEHLALYK